tara:strand:+ start:814 stop:1194 length:381 start_codon:yes stop_codon:yes gene_type:complete
MAKDLTKLGEDTQIGLDVDGDGKPDFKINLRAIGMVVVAIISGTMFYYQIMEEIELAKELPKVGTGTYIIDQADPQALNTYPPTRVEFNMKDQMSRMTLDQLIKKVEEMEEELDDLKIEVAKKRDR